MKIVIIGGIAAGMSIASKAIRTNPAASVTIVEKEDYISFGACGLPYYLGDQFDDINEMFARSVDQAQKQGINLMLKHEALNIDFDNKLVKIRSLEEKKEFDLDYDKLVIATGAYPLSVLEDKKNLENQYTITKPYEVDELKSKLSTAKNIVVIGGGFIGLEVAEQLAHLGKNVSLLQRSEMVMRKIFDPEISNLLHEALVENGVDLHLNTPIKDYQVENGKIKQVITEKGSFPADIVIESLGFRPNTAFIDDPRLKKIANGAIVIDEYGKTSIEDVYAAGDCATVYNRQRDYFYSALATYANKMGRLIGENIVSDKQKPYIGALASSVIRIGDYGAGATGLTEQDAKRLELNYKTSLVKANNHSNYWPNQQAITIKLVYDAETRIIYGGQVFGIYGAAERLGALTMAVYNSNTVDELGFMDFAYSPPFASTWDALNVAGNASK